MGLPAGEGGEGAPGPQRGACALPEGREPGLVGPGAQGAVPPFLPLRPHQHSLACPLGVEVLQSQPISDLPLQCVGS